MSEPSPFELVVDVLAGRRRFALEAGAAKVLYFFFKAETDAFVDGHEFVAHFDVRKPVANRYVFGLAPAVVSELMARAGLSEVRSPLVIGLPPNTANARGSFRSYGPKLVWLAPAPERLTIAIRTSPEPLTKPFAEAMPDEGPLRMPTLPESDTLPRADRDFAPPLPCPHCAVASARYRDLGDALVCGACGRSFEAT